jgi:hypothetical protein
MPASPSLLIVPARFKTGKLYTQIATTSAGLVLGSSGDFNVTRATTATRFNSAGVIESVASGVPRLDYFTSGGTAGCPALLVEASGSNLALRSEAFDVSGTWALQSGGTGSLPSVTANAVISPDGTQNAETVLLNRGAGNANGDRSNLEQSITLATSGTYIFSVYAKATTSGDVGKQIFLRVGGGGVLTAYTLTANWVRLTRTETGVASGSNSVQIGNRGTFTNDNSVSVDLWGAQLETGSIATSYIPTTAAAVTRNADVINLSGAVSGCIGQTEGVLYIECESNNGLDDVIFINQLISDAIVLTKNANNAYIGQIYYSSNPPITFTSASGVTGMVKIAIAYKSGDSTMYLNGSQVGTLNTTAITFGGALSRIGVSKSTFFAGAKPSRIRAIATYTTRLTDPELTALTTL